MKGVYVLYVELNRDMNIRVGSIGQLSLKKGFYAYVGSAMNSLSGRIMRHLRKDKKIHWHIDYLLARGKITAIHIRPSGKKEECAIAQKFAARFHGIVNFGCSDCKCASHLFYSENLDDLRNWVQ